MSYIGADELVTYKQDGGVYSGGFNVNSVLMKLGISPMVTLNNNSNLNSNTDKVSDLFESLAIPNWAIAYKNLYGGSGSGSGSSSGSSSSFNYIDDYSTEFNTEFNREDDNDDDAVVDDDIYNTLLGLVSVDKDGNEISETNDVKEGGKNKKKSRRLLKKSNKNKKTKKK